MASAAAGEDEKKKKLIKDYIRSLLEHRRERYRYQRILEQGVVSSGPGPCYESQRYDELGETCRFMERRIKELGGEVP